MIETYMKMGASTVERKGQCNGEQRKYETLPHERNANIQRPCHEKVASLGAKFASCYFDARKIISSKVSQKDVGGTTGTRQDDSRL